MEAKSEKYNQVSEKELKLKFLKMHNLRNRNLKTKCADDKHKIFIETPEQLKRMANYLNDFSILIYDIAYDGNYMYFQLQSENKSKQTYYFEYFDLKNANYVLDFFEIIDNIYIGKSCIDNLLSISTRSLITFPSCIIATTTLFSIFNFDFKNTAFLTGNLVAGFIAASFLCSISEDRRKYEVYDFLKSSLIDFLEFNSGLVSVAGLEMKTIGICDELKILHRIREEIKENRKQDRQFTLGDFKKIES